MRIWRIDVRSWPTDDGKPWERAYGPVHPAGASFTPVPPWLTRLIAAEEHLLRKALGRDVVGYLDMHSSRVLSSVLWSDADASVVIGVTMPNQRRRNFFNRSSAYARYQEFLAFGVDCELLESEPIRWEEPDA